MSRRPSPRASLAMLALAACLCGALSPPGHAKDGGSSGGGGGNSGHGSSNSGHGGSDDGNSGHGGSGGDDDGGDDDGGGGGGGDDGGGGGGDRGRGGGGSGSGTGPGKGGGWETSGSGDARRAVSAGGALPLARVMPVVRKAAPGRVLEVDLQRAIGGGWVYTFLVLSNDGAYREVTVDALRNRVVRVRER